MAAVVTAAEGPQLLSGRLMRDTLWVELTSLSVAAGWPPRTRAAFARRVRTTPFTRLLGGRSLGPDSATLDSIRRDSLRRDSIARAPAGGVTVQPAPPADRPTVPGPVAPRPRPVPRVDTPLPADTPRVDTPVAPDTPRQRARPPRRPRIDSVRVRPPEDTSQPLPSAPRDTVRIP
jgi:hypothetical protein